ncbi:MAG TPA: MATE family efflux transporter [Terriglobia bacterium]|nr:MATE family efflux transporter [Terriglobia bacterium]
MNVLLAKPKDRLAILRRELPPVAHLAWPIVLGNLGWMTMGIVDTMMVGRVSAAAIGAVSLGSILFITLGVFGGGLMLGLDTLVPQAFGADRIDDCHRSLVSSLWFGVPLAVILQALMWSSLPLFARMGVDPAVLALTVPFVKALSWSMAPLMLYFSFRGYLQGMNLVHPVMFALVSANLVNGVGDWVLIYGHWGAPAMGAVGSGWSTTYSRIYMALVLAVAILRHDRRVRARLFHTPLRPGFARIGRLLRLGLPAALQMLAEVGVFALATTLIARLGAVSLAAHQIALNVVSLTYMVPLGIGSAAAVRVGQALGRGDVRAAGRSGWAALVLGAGFMGASAIIFLVFPHAIARLFTPDAAVVRMGARLLLVGAFFQLFDGMQVVSTGALRGTGDTHTAMICHFCAYWLLGLPIGYFLCFNWGWGAVGLWIGLCLSLILLGIVLLYIWHRRVPALAESLVPAPAER